MVWHWSVALFRLLQFEFVSTLGNRFCRLNLLVNPGLGQLFEDKVILKPDNVSK